MMSLSCYRIHDDVTLPKLATIGSACFDIFSYIKPSVPITVYDMSNKKVDRKPEYYDVEYNPKVRLRIDPGDRVLIPTGIIFNIPFGSSLRLHTRSSISLKKGLIMPNGEGIIDSDYYHQTYVMLYNASADTIYIEDNERIAQGEIVENNYTEINETFQKPEQTTDRAGGFGSTGVK
jgi:dUTP pyrophosphatase